MSQHWTIDGHPAWDLELIILDRRECWRVRRQGVLLGYCYTPRQLSRLLEQYGADLADLVELDAKE